MSAPWQELDGLYREDAVDDALLRHELDEEAALPDGFRPTDVGNAARLVAAANGKIRYAAQWSKWLVYRDGVWAIDSSEAMITELAKSVAQRLFKMAITLPPKDREEVFKFAGRCEQAGAIRDMLKLARGVPGVLVDIDRLDAHPWLLNVRNGTVDLQTGQLRPHNPVDLLTMQAPVSFDPTAAAPLWSACVTTWQPDPEVRGYLQRSAGWGLTGLHTEHLFVHVGNGGNGKSKYHGAIADVLGPFCVIPHKSLLVASKHEQHPTTLASLFRARTIVAPETSQDDRLDEEMIKNLTGGDTLRARRMREDEWSFAPSWTAHVHTNHRPRIKGTDDGIWRRVRLVPWSVTIPAGQRDPDLAGKLRNEAPGILNWLIGGALAWQKRGLEAPDSVMLATSQYRTEQDHVGKFLVETMDVDGANSITAKALRDTYEAWCADAGEAAWTAHRIGRDLSARGFDSALVGQSRTRTWIGLDLKGST